MTGPLTAIASAELAGSAIGTYMRNTGAKTAELRRMAGRNDQTGPGSLRRMTGRLTLSISGKSDESIREGQFIGGMFRLVFGSSTPYANVHEQGFSGTVSVPQHTRMITQAFGRSISPTSVTVRAHSKSMRIPKRPYLVPALNDKQDAIANEITRRVYNLILSL